MDSTTGSYKCGICEDAVPIGMSCRRCIAGVAPLLDKDQTIADLHTKLQQAEDTRDGYFDEWSVSKTALHLADKAIAALRKEVEELRAAEKLVSDAYLRIRELVGSWRTKPGGTDRFELTEQIIRDLQARLALYERVVEPVREAYKEWPENGEVEIEDFLQMVNRLRKAVRNLVRRLEEEGSPKVTESVTEEELEMSKLAYLRSEVDAVEGTIVVMDKKDADWLLSRVKRLTEAERERDSLKIVGEEISKQCTILNNKLARYRDGFDPVITLLKDGFDLGSMLVKEKIREAIKAVEDMV